MTKNIAINQISMIHSDTYVYRCLLECYISETFSEIHSKWPQLDVIFYVIITRQSPCLEFFGGKGTVFDLLSI